MAFDAGSVVGRLRLETGEFDQSVAKAVQSSKQAGETAKVAGGGFASWGREILKVGGGFVLAQVGIQAFSSAARTVISLISQGVGAIDDMELAAIRMAGTFKTVRPEISFEAALGQAKAVVATAERLDAIFSGTGQELRGLAETAALFGINLDLSTQKGSEGLVVLGELIKSFNPNVEFQRAAFSEISSVVEGQARAGAMLAKQLQLQGVNLKEQVPLWIQTGTLIEEITKRFPGIGEQLKYQAELLSTMRSSWQSIVTRLLRGGMEPAYRDLRDLQRSLNALLYDQEGQLTRTGHIVTGVMQAGWQAVAEAIKGIGFVLQPVAPLIAAAAVGATVLAKGFAVSLIAIRGVAEAAGKLAQLDFAGALEAVDRAAMGIEKVDLPGYFDRLAGEVEEAAGKAKTLGRESKDLRDDFYKTAEGIEFLGETGQISIGMVIDRLKALRDTQSTTTDEGVAAWTKMTLRIQGLEKERTTTAQQEAEKRVAAEKKVREAVMGAQREILELEGRTYQARLVAIEERRRKVAEETQNELLAARLAALERAKVERDMRAEQLAVVEDAYRQAVQVSKAGLLSELLEVDLAARGRREKLLAALQAGALDQKQFAGFSLALEQQTGLQRAQVFASSLARMRQELQGLKQTYSDTMNSLVQMDARIARLRAEVAGRGPREVLEAEEAVLREGVANEALAVKDRVALSQQLAQNIRQRISLLQQERQALEAKPEEDPAKEFARLQAIAALKREEIVATGALVTARRQELDLTIALRAEEAARLKEQGQALQKAQADIKQFQTDYFSVLATLQAGVAVTSSQVLEMLAVNVPQEMVRAWKAAIAEIVKEMAKLDPKVRRSPSLLDRIRAGLQEAERMMSDFSLAGAGQGRGRQGAEAGRTQVVNIPLMLDDRAIGGVALRFVGGELQGWAQRVPG